MLRCVEFVVQCNLTMLSTKWLSIHHWLFTLWNQWQAQQMKDPSQITHGVYWHRQYTCNTKEQHQKLAVYLGEQSMLSTAQPTINYQITDPVPYWYVYLISILHSWMQPAKLFQEDEYLRNLPEIIAPSVHILFKDTRK